MKKRLRVGVLDLVSKAPTRRLYARVMNPNYAGIMPQVVSVWCEAEGHEVTYICYTGLEDLSSALPQDVDLIFIAAFSQSAQLAYALSNLFRSRGAITALGGPHARCYPQDACKYFDYVLGFTDREIIRQVLGDLQQHRPLGTQLAAARQPSVLPSLAERWKFIAPVIDRAPLVKIVPMISSLGCPYTCSFCIDAEIPYAPVETDQVTEDLKFLVATMPNPRVAWHDPNFGVRFDEIMDSIESAAPPGTIQFVGESSLSLLNEQHLKRMQANGFKAILPGIESWYDMGFKSRTGSLNGMEKVRQVADHVKMVQSYIPYVQANFVLGMDVDSGTEPFELTKRFIDMTPGAFPGYSLLTAFGQAAPANLDYQRHGRVLPFPFHLLNNNHAMNVRPKNYTWPQLYDRIIDLTAHTFSWPTMLRRFAATTGSVTKWMNLLRGVSSEGHGRLRYYRELRRRLDSDPQIQRYFAQESDEIPDFYIERIKRDLGPFWQWLPEGALKHDAYAYLAETEARVPSSLTG